MFRPSVLYLALLLSSPMWWAALVTETETLEAAGLRFLLALPVSAALLWVVRWAMQRAPEEESAEADDVTAAAEGSGATVS